MKEKIISNYDGITFIHQPANNKHNEITVAKGSFFVDFVKMIGLPYVSDSMFAVIYKTIGDFEHAKLNYVDSTGFEITLVATTERRNNDTYSTELGEKIARTKLRIAAAKAIYRILDNIAKDIRHNSLIKISETLLHTNYWGAREQKYLETLKNEAE